MDIILQTKTKFHVFFQYGYDIHWSNGSVLEGILKFCVSRAIFLTNDPIEYLYQIPALALVSYIQRHLQLSAPKVYSTYPVHYSDAITSAMASQITGVSSVCSTVCSGADQRTSKLRATMGIHRPPVDSPSQRASNAENVSI